MKLAMRIFLLHHTKKRGFLLWDAMKLPGMVEGGGRVEGGSE
jgi:hypothetical protein